MTRQTNDTDHVRGQSTEHGAYELLCERCGVHIVVIPPIPMEKFLRLMRQFLQEHSHCEIRQNGED